MRTQMISPSGTKIEVFDQRVAYLVSKGWKKADAKPATRRTSKAVAAITKE